MHQHKKVIVFGPTGNIASVAARTAHDEGASVVLAMRDPKKTIQGLSPEDEKAGRYTRVETDLTNPESVSKAVTESGATSAFFYVAHGSKNHMRSTIEALKSAGIEFVVFLSSYTVAPYVNDLKSCPPSEVISFMHAQVEVNLGDVFDSASYVAVRPGSFATNTLQWKSEIDAGEIKLQGPNVKFDYIAAGDMGRVSGKILVSGQQNGEGAVYLYGPQLLAQKDAIATISKVLGENIKTTPVEGDEAFEVVKARGLPELVAKYIVGKMDEVEKGSGVVCDVSHWEAHQDVVEKYTGKPATTFQQWAEENKEAFKA